MAGKKKSLWKRVLLAIVGLIVGIHLLWATALLALRFVNPPTTGVQLQRRVESWFAKGKYQKRSQLVPLASISPHLGHAVIAAEDGRFYKHRGVDWLAVQKAVEENRETGRVRGASKIGRAHV